MTIDDLKDKFEKTIKITCDDGKIFKGRLTGIENSFETDSGQDEIELYTGEHYLVINIPEIVKAELVE